MFVVGTEGEEYRRKEIVFDAGDVIVMFIIIAFKNSDDMLNNFSKLDDLAMVAPTLQAPTKSKPVRFLSLSEEQIREELMQMRKEIIQR